MAAPLRLVSYLAPSLPRPLFAAIAGGLGRALGVPTELWFETRMSAPPPDGRDPFSRRQADVGFVCAPGYVWLSELEPAPVELAGAALWFAGRRAARGPALFSEVVVRRAERAASFADLGGRVWAYNDPCSLSGYFSVLRHVDEVPAPRPFFRSAVRAGSHLRALRMVARGAADVAAVDSHALALALRRDPELGPKLRVVESWGPLPMQPMVLRATLPARDKRRIAAALLALGDDARCRRELGRFGAVTVGPVSAAEYARERRALAAHVGRSLGELGVV